jgi:hypothetical protein
MDLEIEITEDPYIGLRLQAWMVHQVIYQVRTRRVALARAPVIAGGAPGVFDDIANFFRKFFDFWWWYDFWRWAKGHFWDPIANWFKFEIYIPLLNWWGAAQASFTGWWEGAISRVVNIIEGLKERIRSIIDEVSTKLRATLDDLKAALRERLDSIRDAIGNKISELIERFRTFIENLKDSLHERITVFIERIRDEAERLREHLSVIFGNFMERVVTNLREFKERVWAAILEGVNRLQEALSRHLRDFWSTVVAAIRNWWQQHGPQILDAADKAITTARPYIERWVGEFQKLPATFLGWVASTAGTDLALNPSRSLAVAGSLYTTSIVAGSIAMTLATALNIIPATNWTGAQQFAAYISQVAGFDSITKATYGVLLNEVLAMPLRYHWNQLLRPKLPTEGEIFIMGRKHGITKGEFQQAMAYMGLPDWWIGKMYDFFWTDPSPMWLLRMTEGGIPRLIDPMGKREWLDQWLPGWQNNPYAWLKMKLMLAGYEDVDIEPMISGMKTRALSAPLTQFKTSVRAMLREAYWTKGDAEATLSPWNVRTEEIELLYRAEELDYQKRYLDGEVDYYKARFAKGEIDDQDYALALSTIIVKPERVAQIVAREKVRALPAAKAITAPKEDPLVTSLRKQATDSWIKQYRDWKIDENDLLLGLTIVTQDKDLAARMVAVEKTRYRPLPPEPALPPEAPLVAKARREAIASWVAAFRTGDIDGTQLEIYLQPLIPEAKIRLQVIQMELLRYTPPPAPPVPPSEAPLAAQSRRQAIATWVDAARKGEISFDQLELYLEPLIPDKNTRTQVVNLEMLRYKPTPELIPVVSEDPSLAKIRQEQVAGHCEMFQKRLIGLEQLYHYLLADGLVEPLARSTVITQATKRIKMPGLDSPYFLSDTLQALVEKGLEAYDGMYMEGTITIDQYIAWLTTMAADPEVITYLADTITLRRFLERL